MALNIKDPETDRLARQLAELTGKRITDVVKESLKDRLELELRHRGRKIDWDTLRKLQAKVKAMPVLDDRSPDELLEYDEYGLPR